MTVAEKRARAERMKAAYANGATIQEIAAAEGMNVQRVATIVKGNGNSAFQELSTRDRLNDRSGSPVKLRLAPLDVFGSRGSTF